MVDLHTEAKLLKLKYRREQHLLDFMFDQAQDPVKLQLRPGSAMGTRSSKNKLLKVKRPYTEKFKKSLTYQGPKKWNALPESFHHSQTKAAYKNMVSTLVSCKAIADNQTQLNYICILYFCICISIVALLCCSFCLLMRDN